MKKAKPKLTRQDAERLFAGLPTASSGPSSSRVANPFGASPFGANPFDTSRRAESGEAKLWKDNLVTMPFAIELPPGYASIARLREALTRAWRVRWVRQVGREVIAELPEGWKAVRPPSGPIELRDGSNVVRAVYGWAEDAEIRILSRYQLESQSNNSSGLGSLLIRDRATGQILERSSIWSAMTSNRHPDWAHLSGWLNSHYPEHRDPLRYWADCEKNAAEQRGGTDNPS